MSQREWSSEPSAREIGLLVAATYLVFVTVVLIFDSFGHRVEVFGDNMSYANAAAAIRDWNPAAISPYHFWGLPYVVALVSLLTGTSTLSSVVVVSVLSSFVALIFVYKLWGGWTTAYFVALSWEWLQRSILGGGEPLFMALIVGAFFSARQGRWNLAALLAAYSTVVRPQGIFVLVGIAVALLAQREWRRLLMATVIGAVVGALYMIPMQIYYGDPLANFHFYQQQDWHTSSPVSIPFVPLVNAVLTSSVPSTTVVRELFWVLLTASGVAAMLATRRFRTFAAAHMVEATFAALFAFFVFSYNSDWTFLEFARFALPLVPLALFALEPFLPRDRRILWLVAPVSAILAAASALNARDVLDTIRSW